MKIRKLAGIGTMICICFLFACAPSIKNISDYEPVRLEIAENMRTSGEINKYKIAVLSADERGHELAKKAKLGDTIGTEIERILSEMGTVELVNRETSKKLADEFLNFSDSGVEPNADFKGLAPYVIFSKITKAALHHKFSEASQWTDEKGKVHKSPPKFQYTANVAANIKIYQMPDMKTIKVINFENNASRSEDTRSCDGAKDRDDNLMVVAAQHGIKEIEKELKSCFSPKGYILKARSKEGKYIFETTLGTNKIKKGDNIDIYSIKTEKNQRTGQDEQIASVIAKGKVSDKINEKRSWIVVKEGGHNVRGGDYVKVVFKKGALDVFNVIREYYGKFVEWATNLSRDTL